MATIALTDALRHDYASLFNSCVINAARTAEVVRTSAVYCAVTGHYLPGDPRTAP